MWKSLVIIAAVAAAAFGATDKFVCYLGSWANYRLGDCKYTVDNVDATLCTHVIYGFVGMNADGSIRIMDSWLDEDDGLGALRKFANLKSRNSKLKSLVAIGGWNEGSMAFTKVVSSPTLRATFIANSIAFMQKYGFDGFDLDWEYPAQRGGAASDKANFSILLAEFRAAFDKYGYLLTAAVAAASASVDLSYEVPQLSKYLDFINVMTYDLHGAWDPVTGHNAPLYPLSSETGTARTLNVDACISGWIQRGADPKKIILGIGTYGRTFTLSGSNNGIGAPTSGAGSSGPCTGEMGYLGYNEICQRILGGGWTVIWNNEQQIPYAYNGNQWVGYDNEQSVTVKTEYAKAKGLGGVMIWSLETDDFNGLCGKKNPLLNAIRSTLNLPSSGDSGGSGGSDSGNSSSSTTSTTTTTTKAPSTGGSGCCTSDDGFCRDPTDCNVFYQCVAGAPYKFTCVTGLCFDPSISSCNYCSAVSC